MPGTPASAAYTDEAYAMTRKGQGELALGAGLVFSVIGGLFGTAVLILAAPALAEVALQVQLVRVFLAGAARPDLRGLHRFGDTLKGIVSLLLGLLVASVGLDNPAAVSALHLRQRRAAGRPRADPDHDRHVRGVRDPALRRSTHRQRRWKWRRRRSATCSAACGRCSKKYPLQTLRGSVLGTLIGALPGAGADIAAWMSYAMTKKFSKEPEKFGTGHRRGHRRSRRRQQQRARRRLDAGAGVRHSRRLDHRHRDRRALHQGPQSRPDDLHGQRRDVYAVFMVFILANLLMLPLGWARSRAPSRSCACRATC